MVLHTLLGASLATFVCLNTRALAFNLRSSIRAPSRVLLSSSRRGESHRLERILSNRGRGSRREVSEIIKKGRVRVNGVVVKVPSAKFPTDSKVFVDGDSLEAVPLLVAFNKPLGVLSTMGDPSNRLSLLEFAPPKWKAMGLHPVGRLDADTTGLLLFSSDGALTQRLLHPDGGIEREYEAEVEGNPLARIEELKDILALGVETSEGVFPATLLDATPNSVRLTVCEGKYRMVRRILANAGHPVTALHRRRYGKVVLDDLGTSEQARLPAGEFTEVNGAALEWARAIVA